MLSTGETYIRQALRLTPRYAPLLPILARLLQLQDKHADAYAQIEQLLAGPAFDDSDSKDKWERGLIMDALKCGLELLQVLTKPFACKCIIGIFSYFL